jgi:hypothetical protein
MVYEKMHFTFPFEAFPMFFNITCKMQLVFKSKNHSKTQFHRNGLLAALCTNFQEGQN